MREGAELAMTEKKTIKRDIRLSGIGVHSGKNVNLTLRPSESGRIVFRRTDLGNLEMALNLKNIEARNGTAIVGEKFKIRTVEHLLAVLYAFGISSLDIELDADEIPILDGSALPFVQVFEQAGTKMVAKKISHLKILKAFVLEDKDAVIFVTPAADNSSLVLSYTIEYPHSAIQRQTLSLTFHPDTFIRDIAPARTFGFFKDAESLRSQGLALGSSFENAVVLDEEKVMNGPLRFPDEFVRHKLLDLVGDLALLGHPLIGSFRAHKAGHGLHLKVVQFINENPDYWQEL
jgi:UDP-3-O-[3-hydroxymyristoyl] N-acetylglucosamine deacetylase